MNIQELVFAVQNGLTFKPMDEMDCAAFAGAPEGALIASSEVAVYILAGATLSVITEDAQLDYELVATNVIAF